MRTAADELTLDLFDEDVPDALHCHYPGEFNPQPCRLELDLEDGRFTAEYNPEVGNAVTFDIHHGIVRTYPIPLLTSAAVNQLLTELKPLAERILAGAEIAYDGNNWVGRLDQDARAAEEELENALPEPDDEHSGYETVGEYDADEFFAPGLPETLTADTTDAELATLVASAEQEATTLFEGSYTVLTDAQEYLEGKREQMRAAVREQLDDYTDDLADKLEEIKERRAEMRERHKRELAELAAEQAELTGVRDDLVVRVAGFGDSSREIGELAGLTHTAVQQILERRRKGADADPAGTQD